ncbi:MAG: DUF6504 family protein [Anaerolineales bacterium]
MTSARIAQRRLGAGEVVRVSQDRLAGIPAAFTWRGRRYQVRSLELTSSSEIHDRHGGKSARLYRIRTSQGLRVELAHDTHRDRWTMAAVLDAKGG